MLQKPFDFNIHLPCVRDGVMMDEQKIDLEQLKSCFESNLASFKESFCAANFMIFSFDAIFESGFGEFIKNVKGVFPGSYFTVLLDFRDKRAHELSFLKSIGVDGIKFHPYIQKIEKSDFSSCVELAKKAEDLGFFICVDASFGSTKMYEFDNLALAAKMLESVRNAPVVLLHSGGLRVMEAMLLADMCSNVYLDSSLSLLYYRDSPLWDSFFYVYKKHLKRVLYGSDFPYFGMDDTLRTHSDFFAKYGFNDSEVEGILYKSALGFKKWVC